MLEVEQADSHGRRGWRRRAAIAFGIFVGLLLLFHRPLLLGAGEGIAKWAAARENLKLELRLEGNVFSRLIVRNLRVAATGPALVESIEAEYAQIDYSLWQLLRLGWERSLRDVEIKSARVVLDPAKQIKKEKTPDELPKIFPDRARVTNSTLIVRDRPADLAAEKFDLFFENGKTGELRIQRLQLSGGQNWSNLVARTSYGDRNLTITDLVLGEDRIHRLDLDGSRIGDKQLTINLKAGVGRGSFAGALKLTEQGTILRQEIKAAGASVDVNALNKYIMTAEGTIRGRLDELKIELAGQFSRPESMAGTVLLRVAEFNSPVGGFDRCLFDLKARDGKAEFTSAELIVGESRLLVRGSAVLPRTNDEWGRTPAQLELTSDPIDLTRATASMAQHLSGSAQITGRIEIKDARIESDLNLTASKVGFKGGTVEKVSGKITVRKKVPPPETDKAWFTDLKSEALLNLGEIRYRDHVIDSAQGTLRSDNDIVRIQEISVRRKQNDLIMRGDYRLPADFGKAPEQPGNLEVSLNAPELGDYWINESPDRVTGPLRLEGQLSWRNRAGSGQGWVHGAGVRVRDLVFHNISSQWSMSQSVVYLNDFTAAMNDSDYVGASGQIDLHPPHRYEGRIAANIANLATLKPVLEASGKKEELAGSLLVNWSGKGEMRTIQNTGALKLQLENGRFGDLRQVTARVDSSYTPEGLEVPIIFFGSNKVQFQAIARAAGETFEISKIELVQGEMKYAGGFVYIPFVWKNLGSDRPVFPPSGKVIVDFQSENIDVKKLFEDVGLKPAGSGVVNVKVDARGTLENLKAQFDFQARDLRTLLVPNLEPATFELSARIQSKRLVLSGKLQQPKVQPVEFIADLPFDAPRILSERRLDEATPVKGRVHMERSSVNFIRQFVPEVQQLDGDLGLEVEVRGTLGKPVLSGSGDITINVARSNNVTLPALRGFKGRLKFAEDRLTLEQFAGELSGGKFNVTGGLRFVKLTAPDIDLQFKADSILVARNDDLTVRTNADIKIVGPFTSASVTGSVFLTNSQFLKNIDLIPIGLPGRPAPQPPSSEPQFSFPHPPLRDWKFDVVIKTKEPFLIRGNLAHGGAISDLRLTGTGLLPGLEGTVRLENVEATLPFSRLEIAYGFMYFSPDDPFNPKMDLRGTSVIKDYTIHVYVYGTALSPQAVFSSEPPLPQEEIISLLATGTTRAELTGNNNVLAGRAAMLLVQQLYRKVFKQGSGTQSSSVFDRLDVDIGQTDPRTGRRQATARVKLNDKWALVGDLDVRGGFRGMVKYVIRFH